MFVVYTFCALVGLLFAALSWLHLGAAPQGSPGGEAAAKPLEVRRHWALPLTAFGLVGLTLHLLGRPVAATFIWSLLVGPPVGLLAGWVSRRIQGD